MESLVKAVESRFTGVRGLVMGSTVGELLTAVRNEMRSTSMSKTEGDGDLGGMLALCVLEKAARRNPRQTFAEFLTEIQSTGSVVYQS